MAAVAIFVFGVIQLFAGAWATGVTTDEPAHVDRLDSWIKTGWYLPSEELENGQPSAQKGAFANPYVYGPAFSLVAHGVNILVGNESRGEVATTRDAYAVRHMIVALLAAAAAAAVGAAVWSMTRSRRLGFWAAAGLLAVPAWMGHGFFNLKDIPAGAGYTLVTAGLILALRDATDDNLKRLGRVLVAVCLGAGIFIGAGTRISLWAPFLAMVVAYGVLRACQWHLGKFPGKKRSDRAVLVGVLVGGLAIVAAYPNAAIHPVSLLIESVNGSANYPNPTVTLTAGQLLSEHPPFWYLPAYVGASYPLLLGALGAAGAILGVRGLISAWRAPDSRRVWMRSDLGLLLALQQAALLPLLAIVGGAVMYDGIRQHLYVLPAIAMLAGVGAAKLGEWGRHGTRGVLTSCVLILALVIPIAEETILFPYNYTYVNAIAGIGSVNDHWETDYWQASLPEALSHVPRGVPLRCAYELVPPGQPRDVHLKSYPCPETQVGPFAYRRGTDTDANPAHESPALWVIAIKRGPNRPPSTCEQVDNVTRWLLGQSVTMFYVLRCPR